ncbi:NinE family protein [Raoultella ornithinolytica]|uniref:NinE family protein n=1 Tax=Raoultella TaxID=160674 RepID=UPI001C559A7F|nr:NinE family protein [Raoultella ornithinolytica]QXW32682.1 NinE family protein [Raoultella ornithinolytica]HCH7895378.1 NinE family protein [Raoultella ornithinolytica]HDV8371470.1 NinE family protein [Raoultella ornithinolytica]
MSSQLAKVIERGIFRVPARRRKRKAEVKPSDIPTFHYTAHLADVRWLRHAARRKNHG